MRKTLEFEVNEHQIKITNSWVHGAKLYVDGDLRDFDKTFHAFGKETLMSANLQDEGILEIVPLSGLWSVEMDAFLLSGSDKKHVYSSHKRVPIFVADQ